MLTKEPCKHWKLAMIDDPDDCQHCRAIADEKEIEELKQQRDDAADSALGHASKYSNIVQAITDPENQPSQYGTVTLAMYNKLKQQRDELLLALKCVLDTADAPYTSEQQAIAMAHAAIAKEQK